MQNQGTLARNDEITLPISSLGSEGQGIGRHEGMSVFVPFALPGENAKVHIIKTAKNYAVGKLVELMEESPERTEPRCPSFGRCGGCTLLHMAYPAQLQYKKTLVENAICRIGGVKNPHVLPVIGMEEPFRYRNKASFPFARVENQVCFGFYAPRSHRLIPIGDCFIEREELVSVARAVQCYAEENDVSAYEETAGSGCLRHVVARVTTGGELMAVIVTKGRPKKLERLVETLRERCPGLVSIVLNRNDADTNAIFGAEFETLWGQDTVTERLCGFTFHVSAASFLQVNPVQTEKLYETVEAFLPQQGVETACDLYCGAGTISMIISRHANHVIGIENGKEAVEDAKRNAARNGVGNARFLAEDAAVALPRLIKEGMRPQVIVADPPRKGMDPAVIEAILASGAPRLIYVSCDPATLARDVKLLTQGGYRLEQAQPVDMFPQPAHVETCVLLCREKPEKVLNFSHFCDFQTFTEKDDEGRKKELNRSIGVSIARDRVTGNMSEDE